MRAAFREPQRPWLFALAVLIHAGLFQLLVGWDRSRVHGVEPIESGGFVVRLNDRCVVVITLLAMPACKIGSKPARGDLFEHMDDASTPGDWKDQ